MKAFIKGLILKRFFLFLVLSFKILNANDLEFDTLKSDFTQRITNQNKSITYSGHFIIDSKFGAFWQYENPNLKFVYFSKTNIIIIEPDLEQAVITQISDAPDLLTLLSGAKQINKSTFEANFDDVKYRIFTQNALPAQISYTDKLGNDVKITLKNTHKNEAINKELLEPKIPQNYDIITN